MRTNSSSSSVVVVDRAILYKFHRGRGRLLRSSSSSSSSAKGVGLRASLHLEPGMPQVRLQIRQRGGRTCRAKLRNSSDKRQRQRQRQRQRRFRQGSLAILPLRLRRPVYPCHRQYPTLTVAVAVQIVGTGPISHLPLLILQLPRHRHSQFERLPLQSLAISVATLFRPRFRAFTVKSAAMVTTISA